MKSKALIISTALGAILIVAGLMNWSFFQVLEHKSEDFRNVHLRKSGLIQDDIVILDIDDTSLQSIGAWVWPRRYHGQAVDFLSEAGAKVIGFDILFPEPDTKAGGPESDAAFAEHIKGDPVCLAMMFHTNDPEDTKVDPDELVKRLSIGPISSYGNLESQINLSHPVNSFVNNAERVATLDVEADLDGVYRRRASVRRMQDRIYPGIDVVLAAMKLDVPQDKIKIELGKQITFEGIESKHGGPFTVPVDDKGQMRLNYYGDSFSFRFVKYAQVIHLYRYQHKLLTRQQFSEVLTSTILNILRPCYNESVFPVIEESVRSTVKDNVYGEESIIPWELRDSDQADNIELLQSFANQLAVGIAEALEEEYPVKAKPVELTAEDTAGIIKKHFEGLIRSVFPDTKDKDKAIEDFKRSLYDKIILVGSSSKELHDQRVSPFDPEAPGVEMVATAIHNIIHEDFLGDTPLLLDIVLMAILAIGAGIITTRFPAFKAAGITIVMAAMYNGIALIAYRHGDVLLPMVAPSFAAGVTYSGILVIQNVFESKDKAMIAENFGKFLGPTLLEQVMANPDMLNLGGALRNMSVSFSGLVGFTEKTHHMKADEVISMLRESHTVMTQEVLDNDGYLDKFEGDTIMAFWGAPVPFDDHPLKGCITILNNLKHLDELNQKWSRRGLPTFTMEAGLNSGEMVVGNIGSNQKMDYSIIGDVVNTAARVRGANKIYGTQFVITGFTYPSIKNYLVTRHLDDILFIGKLEPIPVYEVLCTIGEITDEIQDRIDMFAAGKALYVERKWDEAQAAFRAVLEKYPDDGPSQKFIERIDEYRTEPLPDDWDGRYVMKTK